MAYSLEETEGIYRRSVDEEEPEEEWTEALAMSRLTIYQSALDVQNHSLAADSFDDEDALQPNHVVVSNPKDCKTMFRDGRRVVDFVLAYETSQGKPESIARREKFEKNLEEDGLELERESVDRVHFVKVHAPREVLRRYAEILRLRLPMKQVPGGEEEPIDYDIIKEFKSLFSKLTTCVHLNPKVFPPDKFNLTAEYNRHKAYLFDESKPEFFSRQVRTLVVDFILERTSFVPGQNDPASVGIHRLISEDTYKAAYPLHDGGCKEKGTLRNLLLYEWAQVSHWAMYQPVDQIREYFGVAYALYFAWLGFYTHMLIPAAVVGLVVFFYGVATMTTDRLSNDVCDPNLSITMCPLCDRTCDYWQLSATCTYAKLTYLFDNSLTVFFAIFMSFWATLFLELWKRYSASIVHRWGLGDYSIEAEPPRAGYLAKLKSLRSTRSRRNFLTGQEEPYAPFWSVRVPALLFSFSAVVFLTVVAVGAVFGVVLYRMSVVASLSFLADSTWATSYSVIPVTAAVINLICIMILNWVYDKLAVYLTEMELLRTQTEFDESLTVKIYMFQFVNYYTSIMYLAFLKGKFVGYPAKYNRIFGLRQEECNPGGCLVELSIQLAIIMVGQQIYAGIMEMLIPWLIKKVNDLRIKTGLKYRDRSDTVLEQAKKQWTEDYKLLDWGPRGLFYEYLEMVMQYGFVTLFVTAFPLAPFFALLNNVFEMRLDAKKFLMYYRRPVPRRVPNIGVWFKILNIVGRLAVISNAFIIAFSSNFIPKLVYRLSVSGDGTDEGFLEHSLAYFNTSDFPGMNSPRNPSLNVSICRYSEYRESFDSERKYKRPAIYWHVLAARLAFIVVFQNVVSLVMICVEWMIPDVPAKLRNQIRREAYLTNEIIIRHETTRAKQSACEPEVTTSDFIANEQIENQFRYRVPARDGQGGDRV